MNKTEDHFDKLEDRMNRRLFRIGLFLGAIMMVAFIMCSCSPTKRIATIAARHPGALAGPCAQFYPVRVIDSTRIEYFAGDIEYMYDTVYADCEQAIYEWAIEYGMSEAAIQKMAASIKPVKVPCPPSTHRVDTVITDSYRQVENTAKIDLLTQERDKAQAAADRLKQGRNVWRWIALALGALFLIGVILRLWKKKLLL